MRNIIFLHISTYLFKMHMVSSNKQQIAGTCTHTPNISVFIYIVACISMCVHLTLKKSSSTINIIYDYRSTNLDTEVLINRMPSGCSNCIIAPLINYCNWIFMINILFHESLSSNILWKLFGKNSFISVIWDQKAGNILCLIHTNEMMNLIHQGWCSYYHINLLWLNIQKYNFGKKIKISLWNIPWRIITDWKGKG